MTVSAGGLEVRLGEAGWSQPMIQHDVQERQASAAAQDYSGEHGGLQGPQPSPGHGGNIPRRHRGGGEPWPSEPHTLDNGLTPRPDLTASGEALSVRILRRLSHGPGDARPRAGLRSGKQRLVRSHAGTDHRQGGRVAGEGIRERQAAAVVGGGRSTGEPRSVRALTRKSAGDQAPALTSLHLPRRSPRAPRGPRRRSRRRRRPAPRRLPGPRPRPRRRRR